MATNGGRGSSGLPIGDRATSFQETGGGLATDPVGATVSAGNHFSVFLDQASKRLDTSGENVVGQLGIGRTGFDVKTPVEVELPEDFDASIVSVSAGLLHTTACSMTETSMLSASTTAAPCALATRRRGPKPS
ncbi:MAG: RCC1 domain-containing protein [Pseudomonadota bacterium]